MTFEQIQKQIAARQFAPVYYLHGDETYFIDKLTTALDAAVLTESEAAFNRSQLYGADTNANQILNACRSFPVMANHRLVIVKEAQRLAKTDWDKMAGYLEKPVPSTVLVLAFKPMNDRKTALPAAQARAVGKSGVDFDAKKMYDRDIIKWVAAHISEAGFEADAQVPTILVTNLGTHINLIENELEKMFILLRAANTKQLSQKFVFEMINVDKDFNVFELIHALSEAEAYKAHMIIDRLTQNSKINPAILTLNALFRFFQHLGQVHSFNLHDANAIKNQLNVNFFAARDYAAAKRHYSPGRTWRNLRYIRDADLQLKGGIATHMDERHILKTLVWRILN